MPQLAAGLTRGLINLQYWLPVLFLLEQLLSLWETLWLRSVCWLCLRRDLPLRVVITPYDHAESRRSCWRLTEKQNWYSKSFKTFPHFHDEQHKLLGCGLWPPVPGSAWVPQGPDGAAAHDSPSWAGDSSVFRGPPRAAAAVSHCALCPHLVRPLQQHASVLMDGP